MIIVLFCYLAIRGENGWEHDNIVLPFSYICPTVPSDTVSIFVLPFSYLRDVRENRTVQCETGAKMVEGFGLG
jgi:hypothetical protein